MLNDFHMDNTLLEKLKNEISTFFENSISMQGWKKTVLSALFVLFAGISSFAQSSTILDGQDLLQQISGWEWVACEKKENLTTTYPVALEYSSYSSHLQYKVIKNRAVYAEDGNLKGIIYCLRYVQYFEDPSRISEKIDREVASEHEKQQEEYESKEFDEWVKGITNKIQNSTSFPEGCFIMNLYSQGSEELGPSQFNITKQWTIEDIKRYNSGQPLPLFAVFRIVKKNAKSMGDIPSYLKSIRLKEKDLKALNEYIDLLNADSKNCTFSIEESENGDYAVVGKRTNVVDKLQFDDSQLKKDMWKEHLNGLVGPTSTELQEVKEATDSLKIALAIADYKNNKYNINKESQAVRVEIEKQLGIRKPEIKSSGDTEAKKKWGETQAIKIMCRHLGVAYTTGMTKEKLAVAVKRKYQNLDEMALAAKLQKAIFAAQVELASNASALINSMPAVDNANVSTANRYIQQLNHDNSKWTSYIKSITRIDDTSFKLTYGEGHDNKYVTIKYETDMPFSYKYEIIVD